jgi:predicted GNAT family acetyltransferase
VPDVRIRHNADGARYEAWVGPKMAGFAEYQITRDLIVFTHTEVDPAYEGQGVGSALAREALDDVRSSDRKVLPLCPFIKGWIGGHREYVDLVYGAPPSTVID